jgi:hypothetical protein
MTITAVTMTTIIAMKTTVAKITPEQQQKRQGIQQK